MPRRSGEQTKWAATFHVASELARRGWQVGLTLGNTETVDILASHPEAGRQITIDVKGIHALRKPNSRNHWFGAGLIGEDRSRPNHYLVFVAIPDPPDSPRSYVVPGEVAVRMAETNRDKNPRLSHNPMPSLFELPPPTHPDFESLQGFRDAWGTLRELPSR